MLVNLRTHEMDHLNKLSKLNQKEIDQTYQNHLWNWIVKNLTHTLSKHLFYNAFYQIFKKQAVFISHKLLKKNIYEKVSQLTSWN